MSFMPGVCPKCREYIFLKDGVPLLLCPLCDENISSYEAAKLFDAAVSNPQKTNQIIAKCLQMEEEYGPDAALVILDCLTECFPKHEEAAYLCVKMSGFETVRVREYLEQFADIKKRAAFAGDFLEKTLTFKNFSQIDLFERYINNKFSGKEQSKWLQKIADMNAVYAMTSQSPAAHASLYVYYIFFTLLNAAAAILFLVTAIEFWVSILIVVGIFISEMFLLFLHNKKFGDRLNMSSTERFFMVTFLCSIVVAMGGMFMGALF